MTNFERSLYADPEADLDARWWELVERYQLVRRPEGREAPDWAAKIHIACAPVYYHNYLYGQIVASQLAATLERECGGLVERPDAGRLLAQRVFAPGPVGPLGPSRSSRRRASRSALPTSPGTSPPEPPLASIV